MRYLLCLLLALPAFGQQQPAYTLSPSSGYSGGGTQVTITGSFQWGVFPYRVFFGSAEAQVLSGSNQQLVVRTPPHLPARTAVTIREAESVRNTGLFFTFEGESNAFERILLPVFVTVPGAFGSVFRTELTASLTGTFPVEIYGLQPPCRIAFCADLEFTEHPLELTAARPDLYAFDIETNGNPGRFVYLPRNTAKNVGMNLRAYDTSRAAENFGTEVPVVRMEEYSNDVLGRVTLTGIPTDARFRNTLRIYGVEADELVVRISSDTGFSRQQVVRLRAGADIFDPAYAEISDFPAGVGTLTVDVQVTHVILSPPAPRTVWAFVSVTNNQMQHITTITPQP